jgi:hypothetical protein
MLARAHCTPQENNQGMGPQLDILLLQITFHQSAGAPLSSLSPSETESIQVAHCTPQEKKTLEWGLN